MKNQHQFMINVGKKFEPTLQELSKKMAGASYADLARWGITILNRTTGETPFLAYANRLGDRSIADIISQLWKMWVNGEIKLPDDIDDQRSS
jgi:hypothetical protein